MLSILGKGGKEAMTMKNTMTTPQPLPSSLPKRCNIGRRCNGIVYLDNIDEAGHYNYVCKECGEPQDD